MGVVLEIPNDRANEGAPILLIVTPVNSFTSSWDTVPSASRSWFQVFISALRTISQIVSSQDTPSARRR